jgi:uncharacterized protein
MKPRAPDPRRLDMAVAAREGWQIEGEWPLAGFERLREGGPRPEGEVVWTAQAGLRAVRGGAPQVRLRLTARADVARQCQRCLEPVVLPLHVDRDFVFAPDEASAAQLDEHSEEDVLALTRSLDLHELVEDELLLALPLVPRHDICPRPLPSGAGPGLGEPQQAKHPFAGLAALKRRSGH